MSDNKDLYVVIQTENGDTRTVYGPYSKEKAEAKSDELGWESRRGYEIDVAKGYTAGGCDAEITVEQLVKPLGGCK